jgi:hypothetical protein
MRASEIDRINAELNSKFKIVCTNCGKWDVQYYNDVRYYDYTGKVGSAGIHCTNCDTDVVIDE